MVRILGIKYCVESILSPLKSKTYTYVPLWTLRALLTRFNHCLTTPGNQVQFNICLREKNSRINAISGTEKIVSICDVFLGIKYCVESILSPLKSKTYIYVPLLNFKGFLNRFKRVLNEMVIMAQPCFHKFSFSTIRKVRFYAIFQFANPFGDR